MNIIQRPANKYSPGVNAALFLVLHDTAGSFPGDLNWLLNPIARVSVHYLVAPNGDVYQMVRDHQRAWHAGESSWDGLTGMNAYSTGIEISHITGKTYPAAQLHALDQLILLLYSRHHYRGTVGHKDIAYPRGRKSDPQLDVSQYSIQAVKARLGQMEEDDMFTDQDRALLQELVGLAKLGRISEISFSFDREREWMMAGGASDMELSELQIQKAEQITKERKRLGLS